MTLISENSVLNRIGEIKSEERTIFSIGALVTVIKMIDISYCRLFALLERYKESSQEEVIMQAWLVIGNLNKLRCLLDKVSGIKKNEPWFKLFIKKIENVENPRNFIEHYDNELSKLIVEVKPLLGYISWLTYKEDKIISTISIPGILRKCKGLELVNPVGKIMRSKVDHINYFLGDNKLNI